MCFVRTYGTAEAASFDDAEMICAQHWASLIPINTLGHFVKAAVEYSSLNSEMWVGAVNSDYVTCSGSACNSAFYNMDGSTLSKSLIHILASFTSSNGYGCVMMVGATGSINTDSCLEEKPFTCMFSSDACNNMVDCSSPQDLTGTDPNLAAPSISSSTFSSSEMIT